MHRDDDACLFVVSMAAVMRGRARCVVWWRDRRDDVMVALWIVRKICICCCESVDAVGIFFSTTSRMAGWITDGNPTVQYCNRTVTDGNPNRTN